MSLQLDTAGCDPLDELYDALAEVVGTEDTTQCYKSYLLVLNGLDSAYQGQEGHIFLSGNTCILYIQMHCIMLHRWCESRQLLTATLIRPKIKLVFVLQPSGDAVSLLENAALISVGTTGLVTWEAALYLGEWALDHQETFTNRSASSRGIRALFLLLS